MKKMMAILFLMSIALYGCNRGAGMQFCEGVSVDGDGVNCGTEFESGELTAIVRSDSPFDQEKISIEIYNVRDDKKEKVDTIPVTVKAADSRVNVTLPLYTDGTFFVKAIGKDGEISKGEVKIVDY